jgi:TetR/AcrR family transcriptional regulator
VAESQPEGDTEARILEAARRVFMLRGTAGARMQEIAAEAGVNQALLHYYFRTKDRLAEAVFREAAGRLAPTVLRILGSDEPIEAKVEQFVQAYIDAVRRHPFIPGYILAELHHHPERLAAKAEQAGGIPPAEIARALIGKLDVQLRTAAEAGALRPIAAAQFVVNLIALCVFPFAARPALTIGLGMDDGAFDRFLDERRASLPSFILSGLRP